jgi:hypothetical protein
MLSRGARLGRQICLVLGVLSLVASFVGAVFDEVWTSEGVEAEEDRSCGTVSAPNETLSSSCSQSVQAHAQISVIAAIAGVGWMLGAAAFSMAAGQAPGAATAPGAAYPAYPGYPAGAPAPVAAPPRGYGGGGPEPFPQPGPPGRSPY